MCNSSNIDQALAIIGQVLGRCVIMGVIVLLIWWGALGLLGDLVYGFHSKLFSMTREQFNIIHYTGMLTTKAAISLLFFLPYIAIKCVIKKRKQ